MMETSFVLTVEHVFWKVKVMIDSQILLKGILHALRRQIVKVKLKSIQTPDLFPHQMTRWIF